MSMTSRAESFWQRAIDIFFGSSPILTRLLRGPHSRRSDLESQARLEQPLFTGCGSNDTWNHSLDDSSGIGSSEAVRHHHSPPIAAPHGRCGVPVSSRPSEDDGWQRSESIGEGPANLKAGPIQGPSRLIVHRDGGEAYLGLVISDEMVSVAQQICDETQKLEYHGKLFDDLRDDILAANKLLLEAKDAWGDAEGEEARRLEEEIEQQGTAIRIASEQRGSLGRDIDAFKFNLKYANQASHDLLKNLLEEAGLLAIIPPSPENSQQRIMYGNSVMAPQTESTGFTEEESSRKAVRKELSDIFDERTAAQQEFDDLDNIYREQLADYKEAFANGETIQTQSEFDVGYVMDCRSATRRLIEAEESFEEAKSRALAIGAVGSTFDQPQYGNWMDEWETQSETAEELLERNAFCDWSFVGEWVASLADTDRVAGSELKEVDDWDARSINLGESRSVVADVEMYRDKIDFWRESCAQLREQMLGQVDAEMR